MSEQAKKLYDNNPEGYDPKTEPALIRELRMLKAEIGTSDIAPDPFQGGEPPRSSNRIREYRRLGNWENFFLASAIYSVAQTVGVSFEHDFHFIAALLGDEFSYLYSRKQLSDSGITNSFFVPQVVKKAYEAIGYDCIYLSNAQIKKDFRATMNMIKASVDKGRLVLAWGMGNVIMANGVRYDPLPEGALIGGYEENDRLLVNLYPGEERLYPGCVDEDGYTVIEGGLDTTLGLFFIGEPIEKPALRDIYQYVIDNIPVLLTMKPTKGYYFGKAAFDQWAETLLDDTRFEHLDDDALNGACWDLHCNAYCNICTKDAPYFIGRAVELFPDMTIAAHLLPLYEQMAKYKDDIWAIQGDFFPSADKFRTHECRKAIADCLHEMGRLCEKIVAVFNAEDDRKP